MQNYKQLILFGSPGTGKSHMVQDQILPEFGIEPDSDNIIRTVFHPEYTYGDFMGKLLPLTKDGHVKYNYYEGFFLKALAQAYKNILDAKDGNDAKHVALIIDEINRGNSAAIFGTVFQLLDRNAEGWSTYEINVSDMEFDKLLELIDVREVGTEKNQYGKPLTIYEYKDRRYKGEKLNEFLAPLKIKRKQIRIPGNMSIIATMNTSDSSIYYMDAAFKRRWNWQYVNIDSSINNNSNEKVFDRKGFEEFINKLNSFIKSQFRYVRKAEDKQIGYYFIQEEVISKTAIQNKIMFFLWDGVFTSSKEPLVTLLGLDEQQLVTFGDFANHVDNFIDKIKGLPLNQ